MTSSNSRYEADSKRKLRELVLKRIKSFQTYRAKACKSLQKEMVGLRRLGLTSSLDPNGSMLVSSLKLFFSAMTC